MLEPATAWATDLALRTNADGFKAAGVDLRVQSTVLVVPPVPLPSISQQPSQVPFETSHQPQPWLLLIALPASFSSTIASSDTATDWHYRYTQNTLTSSEIWHGLGQIRTLRQSTLPDLLAPALA